MSVVGEMFSSLRRNENQLKKGNAFKSDKRKRYAPNFELKRGEHSEDEIRATILKSRKQRQKNVRIKLSIFSSIMILVVVVLVLFNMRVFG